MALVLNAMVSHLWLYLTYWWNEVDFSSTGITFDRLLGWWFLFAITLIDVLHRWEFFFLSLNSNTDSQILSTLYARNVVMPLTNPTCSILSNGIRSSPSWTQRQQIYMTPCPDNWIPSYFLVNMVSTGKTRAVVAKGQKIASCLSKNLGNYTNQRGLKLDQPTTLSAEYCRWNI